MHFFPRFNMMQDGMIGQHSCAQARLGNPPICCSAYNSTFPTPAKVFRFFIPTFTHAQRDSNVTTTNAYDLLTNDPDIGPNPDVAYVTGTGAFDQIFITKLNPTQAQVTVNAYADAAHTNLITRPDDG